ncbi:helix-turn-helix domain-containing protein [Halocatena pleomorpha]|uniref:helix-turn-helix domain-containing protein n=1 Tax=Halocatena pleomorpha TaxID=1785090 RepID=UPI001F191EE9|nr:helix-turn-helix domain-containing protein [Halocatena pleomorpha]
METSTDQFAYEQGEAQDDLYHIHQHYRPSKQTQELLQLFNDYRLMIRFPVIVDEMSGITIESIGRESGLQHGFNALPEEVRRRASIKRVEEYSPVALGIVSTLTERQREVLTAAVDAGYYDVPR